VNVGSHAFIGSQNSASDNVVTVSDSGSIWSNRDIQVGVAGSRNRLVITNGGVVYASLFGCLGCGVTGSNNSTVVTGPGSAWYNPVLHVGLLGDSNQLTIEAGASVVAGNADVGYSTESVGNRINITGGSLYVTNATQTGVLDVRCGTLTLSSGALQVDTLIVTNPCGRLIRTGGVLAYGSLILDPSFDADGDGMVNGWEQTYGLDPLNAADANADSDGDGFSNLQEFQAGTDPTNASSAFRVLSVESTNGNVLVTWAAGGGRTNVVQAATDLAGGYSNVSPKIVLAGSGDVTTNYLDAGAATNASRRYYRIRWMP
jgi:T5SS/PEP-CTERM-associated repeat protein